MTATLAAARPGPVLRARSLPATGLALAVLAAVDAASLLTTRLPAVVAACALVALLGLLGECLLRLLPAGALPDGAARAYLAGCTGLVGLLLLGLGLNSALPPLGVGQPLRQVPVLLGINAVCLIALWCGRRAWAVPVRLPAPPTRAGVWAVGAGAALPLAATSGALALDNGRTATLTVIMLLGCTAAVTVLVARSAHLSRGAVLALLYGVALALLLMTSMRGRYVTGHDIQVEYYVFELTHQAWHWQIGSYVNAYNSCLSVTIVPTMIVGVLHVPDVMVFKLLYQVVFAACPLGVFLAAERLAGRRAALLSAAVFMAFPTYFTDMPMLDRQEVAFVLLAGMVLLVTDGSAIRGPDHRRSRTLVFALLGVGTVLSHYSTTYLMILQFGIASVAALLLQHWPAAWRTGRLGLAAPRVGPRLVTVPVVAVLAAAAFLWGGVITHTGGSLSATASTAFAQLTGHVDDSSRSADASSSLLGGAAPSPAQLLDRYVADSLAQRPAGRAYPSGGTAAAYPVSVVEPERASLTVVGRWLWAHGVAVFGVIAASRSGSAQALQVLLALGVLCLFVRRVSFVVLGPEYALLALGGLLMLGMFVLLPSLTLDYGLLRVFQQGLIVLALPTALGCAVLLSGVGAGVRALTRRRPAHARRDPWAVAAVLPLGLLVSSTGLLAVLTGGYLPQLHLADAGENYDSFYIHDSEQAASAWLAAQQGLRPGLTGNVQTDLWAGVKMLSREQVLVQPVVVPGAVATDSWVLAGYDNVERGVAKGGLLNQPVSFTYPLAFLAAEKDLVYSTGQTEVFR